MHDGEVAATVAEKGCRARRTCTSNAQQCAGNKEVTRKKSERLENIFSCTPRSATLSAPACLSTKSSCRVIHTTDHVWLSYGDYGGDDLKENLIHSRSIAV
jgi:hypothetical protein